VIATAAPPAGLEAQHSLLDLIAAKPLSPSIGRLARASSDRRYLADRWVSVLHEITDY
jgi:hypothetical protein